MENTKLCIPTTLINVSKLINKGADSINFTALRTYKNLMKSYCSQNCKNVFYMVKQKKNQSRSQCTKEFDDYMTHVKNTIPNSNAETVGRIMRCFRVKMINRFC